MSPTALGLVGYQRAEFKRASILRSWLIALQFLVAIPSAASVTVENGVILYFLAALGLIFLVAWVWLDHEYRGHRSAGERARRATLIIDGLGETISAAELLAIKHGFRVTASEAKAQEDANYFASNAPPGLRRLGELIEESAFWSESLHADSAKAMGLFFAALIVFFIVALGFALPFAGMSSQMALARVFLSFLVFLLSSDVWGAIQGHLSAARTIMTIRMRLDGAEARNYPGPDVLLIMSDYNAAVEGAPVIVPLLYKMKGARLNQLWAEYLEGRNTASTQLAKGGR